MSNGWVRPYSPGRGRWVVAGWELAALAFLHRTTVALFGLDEPRSVALAAVLAAGFAWLCWRLVDLGVYIGRTGVQIRGLVTRRTVRWSAIDRIVVERTQHDLGAVRIPGGRGIVLDLSDGTRLPSTLWADGIDFRFRPRAFLVAYTSLREAHMDGSPARSGRR